MFIVQQVSVFCIIKFTILDLLLMCDYLYLVSFLHVHIIQEMAVPVALVFIQAMASLHELSSLALDSHVHE